MGLFDFAFGFSKGGGTDVGASKDLMKYQSDTWRSNTEWFNQNGYKFLREGLINADYNPILAIGASPLSGEMPNATAQQGTESFNASMTPSANMQANTAKKLSESQIMVNKATANKTAEEALTQENLRNNYDSQSLLNMLQSERIQKLLPYDVQKAIAEIALLNSTSVLNGVNAAYVPYQAISGRITANAAKQNAETNATWTPAKIAAGGLAGLIGALGIGKLGKVTKPFIKKAKLGNSGFSSSSAKYFTTLH